MTQLSATGYSGTPLTRKLGYREGSVVFLLGAPAEYKTWLRSLPAGVVFESKLGATSDLVHVFEVEKTALAKFLATARRQLKPEASVWVSWPKKASKVPTTITEDTIREIALPLGFVDVKVCAVNEVWSGLKLVIRKELR
ncbi:MAG: DUF3052 family protein [Aquabacterium sp.]